MVLGRPRCSINHPFDFDEYPAVSARFTAFSVQMAIGIYWVIYMI